MQLLVLLLLIGLDQASKYWLVGTEVTNTGIGFGLLRTWPELVGVLVGIVGIAISVVAVIVWPKLRPIHRWAIIAVLAGTISNIIDRIWLGGIRDPFSLVAWFPNFNLADSLIVAGAIVLSLRLGGQSVSPAARVVRAVR